MKTISTDYIKEIKAHIRDINKSLKRVQEAEIVQENSIVNTKKYDKAKNEAVDASSDIMEALKEVVRLASAIGSSTGLYNWSTIHKIQGIDLNNEEFEFDNAFVTVKTITRNPCAPNECNILIKPKDGGEEINVTDFVTFETNKQIAWRTYKQVIK